MWKSAPVLPNSGYGQAARNCAPFAHRRKPPPICAPVLDVVQLTSQFRTLCGGVATLAQTLMDIELVMSWQQDDGQD